MSVQNPERVVTKQDLADFYTEIRPYLGGGGGGASGDYIPIVTELPTPSETYRGKFVFYNGSDTTTSSGMILRNGAVYKCTNDANNTLTWLAIGTAMEGYVKGDDAVELSTSVPALEYYDMRARLKLNRSTTPTSGSTLPITSGAVYTALAGKQDKISYSTSEKAIGTWINGATVYEKVVDCGNMPNNTTKSVAHGISGISKLISCEGCYNSNSSFGAGSINYSDVSQLSYNTAVTVDSTYVKVKTATNFSSYNCFVILRYLK